MENNKTKYGIVELIDRALNKGVIVNADLIITVADVPLLAANLRLALASVETMLKYGVMNDWLAQQYVDKRKDKKEEVVKLNPTPEMKIPQITNEQNRI